MQVLANHGRGAMANFAMWLQRVQGRFAQHYNRRKHRTGALWEGRYHSTLIDGEEHLWQCMTYGLTWSRKRYGAGGPLAGGAYGVKPDVAKSQPDNGDQGLPSGLPSTRQARPGTAGPSTCRPPR